MTPPPYLKQLSLWLACASAVTILLGISVSQILLAIALGVLLLSGLPLRWPPVSKPLGLFLLWTLVALAFSPDPRGGMDQVRKMIVFLMLLVVYSSVRSLAAAKWLTLAWMAVGTFTAGRGLLQFARDVAGARAAHADLYHFYIADRIRGFMSHWMTFSGQELFVLLLLAAFLLFAPDVKQRLWLAIPCALAVGIALILSDTRSIWIASVVAGFYLLWGWQRKAALAMPLVLAIGLMVAPAALQKRALSIVKPEKQTDSNEHRKICWITGWQMIKAHPLLGVGPEKLLVFFNSETLREICALKKYLLGKKNKGALDGVDYWIWMVATNRLTGHSPGFFSVYTLPPNQAVSLESQIKINEKRGQIPERRHVPELILRKSRQLLAGLDESQRHQLSVSAEDLFLVTGSADETPKIPANSVALVVTSPPFLDVVDYEKDNWLRAWFCGIDISKLSIWQIKNLSDWETAMMNVFSEIHRVLQPGGWIAFEVGEVRNGKIKH